MHGDLRGLDEDDVPTIVAWFIGACVAASPTEAHLGIDVEEGDRYRYVWRPVDRELVLQRRQDEAWKTE